MKYFTEENFQAGTAYQLYADYWTEHRDKFSPEIRALNGGQLPADIYGSVQPVELHDSRIIYWKIDRSLRRLELGLRTAWIPRKDITLMYGNASEIGDLTIEMVAQAPTSDIMFHELTRSSSGEMQHSLLFCTGDEWSVTCETLDVETHATRVIEFSGQKITKELLTDKQHSATELLRLLETTEQRDCQAMIISAIGKVPCNAEVVGPLIALTRDQSLRPTVVKALARLGAFRPFEPKCSREMKPFRWAIERAPEEFWIELINGRLTTDTVRSLLPPIM